jgi:hypothetical protein
VTSLKDRFARHKNWCSALVAEIAKRDILLAISASKILGVKEPMRCAECDCKNGGTDCNWIKSGLSE